MSLDGGAKTVTEREEMVGFSVGSVGAVGGEVGSSDGRSGLIVGFGVSLDVGLAACCSLWVGSAAVFFCSAAGVEDSGVTSSEDLKYSWILAIATSNGSSVRRKLSRNNTFPLLNPSWANDFCRSSKVDNSLSRICTTGVS